MTNRHQQNAETQEDAETLSSTVTAEDLAEVDALLASSESAPDWDLVQELVGDLRQRVESMGPVNLDAINEFEELEERHNFLDTQHNDLVKSKDELLQVIAKINETTKAMFRETFDQVRVNFRKNFKELFGTGLAGRSAPRERGRSARIRHRDQRQAARQEAADHQPALRWRALHDGGGAALLHLHGEAEPLLRAGRIGRAAR